MIGIIRAIAVIIMILSVLFDDDSYGNDFWIGLGQGKEDISYEFGYREGNLGANIYVAGDYDYSYGEVESNEPPHNNYRRENNKRVGQGVGFDIMYFSPYWLFIEGGLAIEEYRDIAISTGIIDTGVIYTLDRSRRLKIGYGIGVAKHFSNFLFGIELHNRKGILGMVGWRF